MRVSDEEVKRAGSRHVQLILILGLLTALSPLTVDMYLPALPRIGTELEASDSAVQLTLAGMLLGLAVGQLIVGPLSDSLGRKRPLVIGLGAHAVTSIMCAIAPTVELLAALRAIQGLACAAVAVIVMAIVRDLFDGIAVAHVMSRLMLVMGLAPILAPSLGSVIVSFASWRAVFVVLAAFGALMTLVAMIGIRESLPPARRHPGSIPATMATYRMLAKDRIFVGVAISGGLMTAGMFAYIAGASFVLQDGFGLSTGQFGLVFGGIALCLVITSQINPILVRRYSVLGVLAGALGVELVAALLLLVTGLTGWGGLPAVIACMCVAVPAAALAFPNTPGATLIRHGKTAGTAAAVLGFVQFGLGGLVAPLVGALGGHTAAPIGAVMLATGLVAAVLMLFVVRPAVKDEARLGAVTT